MEVADRFGNADGSVEIAGVIASGTISVDDDACLVSASAGQREITVTGIDAFRKLLDSASAGVELDDIAKDDKLINPCP